ncbi:helicase associated domain-containing protein [Streptomyces canus]|uniref:helicase associated domain-containing protein n=1 Tax=Streptomyces canus TaxID=58343 RepID=UPI003CEBB695
MTVGGAGGREDGEGQEVQQLRLGAWVSNQRSRAATLSPERIEQLSAMGESDRSGSRAGRARRAGAGGAGDLCPVVRLVACG